MTPQRSSGVLRGGAGIFFYTEAVGPVLQIGHVHFPVIMAVYDSFIFAVTSRGDVVARTDNYRHR